MTIIKLLAETDDYHLVQSQSHREDCWLEGWIRVPETLLETLAACEGYCELVVEQGVLVDLIPKTAPPPSPPEPTPDEDRDALLIDLDYRTTLLELGVI